MRLYEIANFHYDDHDEKVRKGLRAANFIKKNCQPWLRESKAPRRELFRGGNFAPPGGGAGRIIPTPTKRRPKDSSPDQHHFFQTVLSMAGAVAHRENSTFTTRVRSIAQDYGDIFVVFPIGNFDYTYVRGFSDMYEMSKKFAETVIRPEIAEEFDFDNDPDFRVYAKLVRMFDSGIDIWDRAAINEIVVANERLDQLDDEELLIANTKMLYIPYDIHVNFVKVHLK